MKKTLLYTLGAVVIVGGAAFAWWTISPLFIDRVVDEELAYEQAKAEGNTTNDAAAAARPTVLAEGTFMGADAAHRSSGTARIVETADGAVLQLEDFEVTNGPDLYVLLTEEAAPAAHAEFGEYIELARLKGNLGNQNYMLPDGVAANAYGSVVIYCKAFSVVFATAALE